MWGTVAGQAGRQAGQAGQGRIRMNKLTVCCFIQIVAVKRVHSKIPVESLCYQELWKQGEGGYLVNAAASGLRSESSEGNSKKLLQGDYA